MLHSANQLIARRRAAIFGMLLVGVAAAVTVALALAGTGGSVDANRLMALAPGVSPGIGERATTLPRGPLQPLALAHVGADPAHAELGGLRSEVGAKIVTGMDGTFPSSALLARARRGQIGGVILFGENVSSALPAAVRALQSAARRAGRRLMIAIDQEGGLVRRLDAAPPYESAAAMTPASALLDGRAAGRALRHLGINTDLAPVADVAHPGTFLGTRAFASSAARVALDACAFAEGLVEGGVNSTFKHFPGLGPAAVNTDDARSVIRVSARVLLADLAPYRRCLPRLVMVSSAVYQAIDPARPAVFSSLIVHGLLRSELAFQGVTISDSMSGPGVSSSRAPLLATTAGIDMLLYTDELSSKRGFHRLLAAARKGLIARAELDASARRIAALTSAG